MLKPAKDYQTLCDTFRWEVPVHYNIGVDICDKWAHQPDRLALIYEDDAGRTQRYTFLDLKRQSNRLANGLKAMGIRIGDRVGILLPQRPETAISHIGLYKLGAIAIPLFTLFGTDALAYRLENSQARGVITDAANLPKFSPSATPCRSCGSSSSPTGMRLKALESFRICCPGKRGLHPGPDPGRRSGPDHLHLGDHGPAQGGAARAPRASRPPAWG